MVGCVLGSRAHAKIVPKRRLWEGVWEGARDLGGNISDRTRVPIHGFPDPVSGWQHLNGHDFHEAIHGFLNQTVAVLGEIGETADWDARRSVSLSSVLVDASSEAKGISSICLKFVC